MVQALNAGQTKNSEEECKKRRNFSAACAPLWTLTGGQTDRTHGTRNGYAVFIVLSYDAQPSPQTPQVCILIWQSAQGFASNTRNRPNAGHENYAAVPFLYRLKKRASDRRHSPLPV
jgi:hypothetical protein